MGTNNHKIVELHGVEKSFGPQQVLAGIDLAIETGQTTVVIGRSGTGKSVLLKTIIGLLRPDAGEVFFDGQRIDNLSERELSAVRSRCGFLFQGGALFDSMTAVDNVSFPLRDQRRMRRKAAHALAREKLAMVGMAEHADKWPSQLSGGEQKRVALARAVAMDPDIILYDEPTTGLDPPRAHIICELILKLQETLGLTSIVVTHDMAAATRVGNRVVMLHDGKLIADGTPEEISNADDQTVACFVRGLPEQEEMDNVMTGLRPRPQ